MKLEMNCETACAIGALALCLLIGFIVYETCQHDIQIHAAAFKAGLEEVNDTAISTHYAKHP